MERKLISRTGKDRQLKTLEQCEDCVYRGKEVHAVLFAALGPTVMEDEGASNLWDCDRVALHGLIEEIHPTLAGLYRRAIWLMSGPTVPGDEKARLAVVGHCFREIMNRLPDALQDVEGFPASKREEENRALGNLVIAFETFRGMPVEQPAPGPSNDLEQTEVIAVPKHLMDVLGKYVAAREEGARNVRERDSVTVLGAIDPLDPALKPWKRARKFFMSCTHIDLQYAAGTGGRTAPSSEVVLAHIQTVEASLRVRLGAFFDNYEELEDIIVKANQTFKEDSVPSKDDVLAALARLGNLQLRRVFYSKLENPLWVAALAKEGAFRNPPATQITADGMIRSDPWPEIDYLVRMAPLVSGDVANVLEPVAESDNHWVRRGIMEAAASMIPVDAARLVPKMKEWPSNTTANCRIDPKTVTQAIVRLLQEKQHRKGVQLASAYFEPRPAIQTPRFGTPEPVAGVSPYSYAEGLPAVADALGTSRLRILIGWLKKYQESSQSGGEALHDTSYIWRPSIRVSSERNAYKVGDSLVEAVRTALAEDMLTSAATLAETLKSERPLLRRIALDVLAEAVDTIGDKSAEHAASLPQREADIAYEVANVIADETFLEIDYRAEYVHLIRACMQWQSAVDQDLIVDAIKSGPPALRDDRRIQLANEGDTPEQVEVQVEDYKKQWQHRFLTTIGAGCLSGELATMLVDLDTEFGVVEVNDEALKNGVFIGPTSPLDAESLRNMSDDELIEHLKNWHPDAGRWIAPSHEGQGRVLTDALSMQTGRLSNRIEDLVVLRPTYVRAIVRAWTISIEAEQVPSWDAVLPFCEWSSQLDDGIELSAEGDAFDDDHDFRDLKFETLKLIDSKLAVRPSVADRPVSADVVNRVVAVLSRYSENSEPTLEYEAKYGGTNMDPLTISLNTMRPVAIRALIRLVHRFPEADAAGFALDILEGHIAGRDHSLAVAAAVGEGTGRLYDSVRPWLEQNVGAIFGDCVPQADYQQVALSTVLAIHNVHIGLIELLRGPLMLVIEQMDKAELVAGWNSHTRTFPQLIGDWIVTAVIGGQMEFDDPLAQAWFEVADATLRGEVLGQLGWELMQWTTVPEDVLERAAGLWDQRIEHVREHPGDAVELAGIYWLARSDKYDIAWWLPRLEFASSVIPDFDTHGMVGERLATASVFDPNTSLSVLENILTDSTSGHSLMHYDLMEHAVPQVIAAALDSNHRDLQLRAKTLMNRLGKSGHIYLKDRVKTFRDSAERG